MAHYEPWQQCKFNVFFQRKCVFEWEFFEKRNEDRRDVLVDREVELGRDGVGNIEIARYSETLALHFSAAVTATRTRNGASKVCSTGLAPMFLLSPRLRKHSRLKTGLHCCIVWTRQGRLISYICDRFPWIFGNETHFDVPVTNSLVLIRRKGFDKLPPLISESFRGTTSADTDLIINSYLASYLTLLHFFLGIIWIEIKIRSTKAKEWGGFWSLNKFHFLFLP